MNILSKKTIILLQIVVLVFIIILIKKQFIDPYFFNKKQSKRIKKISNFDNMQIEPFDSGDANIFRGRTFILRKDTSGGNYITDKFEGGKVTFKFNSTQPTEFTKFKKSSTDKSNELTLNLFTQNIYSGSGPDSKKYKRVVHKISDIDPKDSFKLTPEAKTTNDATIKIKYNLPGNQNKIIVSGKFGEYSFIDKVSLINSKYVGFVPDNSLPTEVVHNKEDDTYSIRDLDTGLFLSFEPEEYISQNFINKDCILEKINCDDDSINFNEVCGTNIFLVQNRFNMFLVNNPKQKYFTHFVNKSIKDEQIITLNIGQMGLYDSGLTTYINPYFKQYNDSNIFIREITPDIYMKERITYERHQNVLNFIHKKKESKYITNSSVKTINFYNSRGFNKTDLLLNEPENIYHTIGELEDMKLEIYPFFFQSLSIVGDFNTPYDFNENIHKYIYIRPKYLFVENEINSYMSSTSEIYNSGTELFFLNITRECLEKYIKIPNFINNNFKNNNIVEDVDISNTNTFLFAINIPKVTKDGKTKYLFKKCFDLQNLLNSERICNSYNPSYIVNISEEKDLIEYIESLQKYAEDYNKILLFSSSRCRGKVYEFDMPNYKKQYYFSKSTRKFEEYSMEKAFDIEYLNINSIIIPKERNLEVTLVTEPKSGTVDVSSKINDKLKDSIFNTYGVLGSLERKFTRADITKLKVIRFEPTEITIDGDTTTEVLNINQQNLSIFNEKLKGEIENIQNPDNINKTNQQKINLTETVVDNAINELYYNFNKVSSSIIGGFL